MKIRRRRKKSPAKFRPKIKTTFLGHESFLLFNLKLQYFVQESTAKFTIFYFCTKKFLKNLVFLTDTVADLAVRYTLCGRYTLCTHCSCFSVLKKPARLFTVVIQSLVWYLIVSLFFKSPALFGCVCCCCSFLHFINFFIINYKLLT
jgi:hypothetical protein